jgi:3-oxo-5-alpha-steroid 4-dehydrogenase 3
MFSEMDPALFCRLFFITGTGVDLGGVLIPSFRENIMNYGSRGQVNKAPNSNSKWRDLNSLIRWVATFQVPHSWFTHYYVVSVTSSLFWGHQLYTQGPAFKFLASQTSASSGGMSLRQVALAWLLMTLQGVRRLYESLTLTKPSQAKMWFGLWIL